MPYVTTWQLVADAAGGEAAARQEFARRFLPVVRAYLQARWRQTPFLAEIDDAVQEVFVECLRQGGVLERVDREHGASFRAFLRGVVRNFALRYEEQRARDRGKRESVVALSQHPDFESALGRVFDVAWAKSVMQEAVQLQAERAAKLGGEAARRAEVLRLRFHEGVPIRDIADRWAEDAAAVHRLYRRARIEFRELLREVVQAREQCTGDELELECEELVRILGEGR